MNRFPLQEIQTHLEHRHFAVFKCLDSIIRMFTGNAIAADLAVPPEAFQHLNPFTSLNH
ncbi:hypothetical protein D3C83_322920 [compost metagenome]